MHAGSAVEGGVHAANLQPVRMSPARGGLRIRTATLDIETARRVEFLDITADVAAIVRDHGIGEGLVVVSSLHSTCAVSINEFQRALTVDIATFLERIAPREIGWSHNDPACSDCDRMNADAHLRALLLGCGVTVQVSGGELVLGRWQRVILAELDGPRVRQLRLQAWDLAPDA